jgi:hypothetical protein
MENKDIKINEEVKSSIRSLKYKLMKDNAWNQSDHKEAEEEYMRFLTLRMIHPQAELAPSKLIDIVWHAHILNTEAYHQDCDRLFGKYLHHVPHLEEKQSDKNAESFEYTQSLFPLIFDRQMISSTAARCEGKACHAPSDCRCR